jgi:hypothetical protein
MPIGEHRATINKTKFHSQLQAIEHKWNQRRANRHYVSTIHVFEVHKKDCHTNSARNARGRKEMLGKRKASPLLIERVDVLVEDELLRVDVLGGVRDGEIRHGGGGGGDAVGVAAVKHVLPAAAGLAPLACRDARARPQNQHQEVKNRARPPIKSQKIQLSSAERGTHSSPWRRELRSSAIHKRTTSQPTARDEPGTAAKSDGAGGVAWRRQESGAGAVDAVGGGEIGTGARIGAGVGEAGAGVVLLELLTEVQRCHVRIYASERGRGGLDGFSLAVLLWGGGNQVWLRTRGFKRAAVGEWKGREANRRRRAGRSEMETRARWHFSIFFFFSFLIRLLSLSFFMRWPFKFVCYFLRNADKRIYTKDFLVD